MRSLPAALTWEFVRRGRWALLGGFAGCVAMPLILFGTLLRQGPLELDSPSLIMIEVILTQVGLMALGGAIMAAVGMPARMFTHPISNTGIALCHLLPAGILAAVMWAVSISFINAILPLGWPVLGPALFAAVAVPAVLAASWYADKTALLPLAIGAVAAPLFLWLKSRYSVDFFSRPDHQWERVSAGEVLFLVVTAIAAYQFGVAGVARQRRHDPLPGVRFLEWLERVLEGSTADGLRFRSAEQAQLWAEWRTKGMLLPGLALFIAATGFLLWLIFSRNFALLYQGVFGSGAMLSLVALLIGLVIGNFGPTDSNSAMGPWLASRPLTSTQLARVVLFNQFKAVASTTLLWQVALVVTSAMAGGQGALNTPPPAWVAHANWILPWAAASTGMLACLGGRSGWIVVGFTLSSVALLIGSVLSVGWIGGQEAMRAFLGGTLVALAIAAFVGTVYAFVTAARRGMISTRVVAVSLLAFLALAAILVWRLSAEDHLRPGVTIVCLGILAWSVAPFAMAPLAVAWNRSR